MAYEALYTRARPKNLAQLVGQEHISNSLARALNQDRLSHAYLLVGTRGTGKTSTARILARAINCDTVHEAKETHTTLAADVIPCNKCEACISFKSSPDNVEFDAASNRSVEDISRLLSTAYLAPLQSRYKTYIIDEVHMLSFEAVNSILKLIEEPPPNVIFFLATTEFNKVPQTIRSRCQILNFKLIPQDIIAEHIIKLAKGLNFSLEDLAVKKIARLAKGSMRDALTFFDQCYSMTDTDLLTVDIVDNTLGLVSDSDLDEIIEAAKSKDRKNIIESTAKAFKSGLTANTIAESIITRLRDIVSKINNSRSPELNFYNEMIDQLRKAVIEMQGSGIPEVILETALFKFASNPLPPPVNNFDYNDGIDSSIPRIEPRNKTNIKPKDNKVIDINKFKVISQREDVIPKENVVENIDDELIPDEIIADYDENLPTTDEDYLNSFSDDEVDNNSELTDIEEENKIADDIPPEDMQQFETESDTVEEQSSEAKKILKSLSNYFKEKEESDIINSCIDPLEVVDFNAGTIFIKDSIVAHLFKQNVKEVEKAAIELFGQEIKFKIVSDGESKNSLPKDETTAAINNLSDEDRKYLFDIMKLLNVSRDEIKLLHNDDSYS